MYKYLDCPDEKLSISASIKSQHEPCYLGLVLNTSQLARETRLPPSPYLSGSLVSIQKAKSPQFNLPCLFPPSLVLWMLPVNENRKALFSAASGADHIPAWPCAASPRDGSGPYR